MADAGLKEIRDLLDTRSKTVADASQAMVAGFTQKSGDQTFKVRRAGFEGLGDLRNHYRRLERSVRAVNTKKPGLRDEVADALKAYRDSLAAFDKALRDTSDDQVNLLKKAAKSSKAAAIDLARARDHI